MVNERRRGSEGLERVDTPQPVSTVSRDAQRRPVCEVCWLVARGRARVCIADLGGLGCRKRRERGQRGQMGAVAAAGDDATGELNGGRDAVWLTRLEVGHCPPGHLDAVAVALRDG